MDLDQQAFSRIYTSTIKQLAKQRAQNIEEVLGQALKNANAKVENQVEEWQKESDNRSLFKKWYFGDYTERLIRIYKKEVDTYFSFLAEQKNAFLAKVYNIVSLCDNSTDGYITLSAAALAELTNVEILEKENEKFDKLIRKARHFALFWAS